MRIESSNGTLVYSADTSYNHDLVDFAANCDLLLCEANLLNRDKGEAPVHLTAYESGDIARKANARRLLLTHLWPGYNPGEVLEEAKAAYRLAEIAQQMKTYYI